MSRIFFTILLLLSCEYAYTQNYRCVNPATKVFYANGLYYLKGMRIDSVRTSGSETILYPFHCYRDAGYPRLDSAGASWMGREIIERADGVTMFVTQYYDTIFINTTAKRFDSWTFYKDTMGLHYEAKVIGVDTAMVMGKVDSVKTIQLTSYTNTTINTGDSLNNLVIKLSEDHGLIQCPDLGIFPMKNFDYLLCTYTNSVNPYIVKAKANLSFKLIDFNNPTYKDLYDFNIGDKLLEEFIESYRYQYAEYTLRTVISKDTSISGQVTYAYNVWDQIYIPGSSYHTFGRYENVTYASNRFIDTSYMPEEWGSRYFYYYYPDDTSFCIKGAYMRTYNGIMYPQHEVQTFEPVYMAKTFKKGIGSFDSTKTPGAGPGPDETKITAIYKGYSCGEMPYLFINNINYSKPAIYPNPATDHLTITGNTSIKFVTLSNITGQLLKQEETSKSTFTLNINDIQPGIYLLKITFADNTNFQQKVTIIR